MAEKSMLSSVFVSKMGNFGFLLVTAIFAFVIFLPAVYILGSMGSPRILMSPVIIQALFLSLWIGLAVTVFNLLMGVPLAWMIVRSRNPVLKWLDNLIDLSLVMPTAALGFSVYFYYGSEGIFHLFGLENGLAGKGPLLIFLLHIVFTLPYMVRSVSAAFMQQEKELEEAADSLGANPFTFFRTVALPLCRQGVINGSILSFTRSLSETGATMMVAGTIFTAPMLVVQLKNDNNITAAAGLSIVLIFLALLILILTRWRFGKRSFDLPHIRPQTEKRLSSPSYRRGRNFLLTAVFLLLVFLPTIYLVLYYVLNFRAVELGPLWGSLALSLGVAGAVTLLNAFLALPLSYLVARNRFRLGALIENLNEIILLVPTSALGLSLALFWGHFSGSELVVLTLAHLCFTFPYFVKPLVTAFSNISVDQEEAAYSLGSSPAETFRLVLLPQIKPALITGAIMAFMRSISETGATLAVSSQLKTVSVLIVDLFKQEKLTEAAVACIVLFAFSLVFLFLLKRLEENNVHPASDKS
jgi:ABC-type sulfate transport system permease component